MGQKTDLLSTLIDGFGKMDAGGGSDRDRDRRRRRSPDRRRRSDHYDRRHDPYDSDSVSPPRRRDPRGYRMPSPEHEYYSRDRDRDRERRRRDDGYISDDRHNRQRGTPFPWEQEQGYEYGGGPTAGPRRRETEYAPPPGVHRSNTERRPRQRNDYYDRDDRYGPPPEYTRRDTQRPRRRDDRDYHDRRDHYDDRRYRDDRMRDGARRSGRDKDMPEWQRQAKGLFMTHAMPVIKKEGPRYAMKVLGNYMAKK